jgi:NTP pyrophosphatase (non-canonical NTP hydrolase)
MITHEKLVKALVKSGQKIIDELSPTKAHLLHMVVGISGEAGELLDAVKRVTIYNKAPDIENIIEELGDLEFYIQGLRAELGITREETLQANIVKLSRRYETLTYSNQSAQERKDKQ